MNRQCGQVPGLFSTGCSQELRLNGVNYLSERVDGVGINWRSENECPEGDVCPYEGGEPSICHISLYL